MTTALDTAGDDDRLTDGPPSDHQAAPSGPLEDIGDPVGRVVGRVQRDLAERRARGDLPSFPPDELERQFSAVVEAVDAGLVEVPPLDPGPLRSTAELRTWQHPWNGSLLRRLAGVAFRPVSRIIGVVVRRQTGPFAARTTDLLEEVIARQNRMGSFLGRVHLDRVRSLEFRIAELEREIEQLRQHGSAGG